MKIEPISTTRYAHMALGQPMSEMEDARLTAFHEKAWAHDPKQELAWALTLAYNYAPYPGGGLETPSVREMRTRYRVIERGTQSLFERIEQLEGAVRQLRDAVETGLFGVTHDRQIVGQVDAEGLRGVFERALAAPPVALVKALPPLKTPWSLSVDVERGTAMAQTPTGERIDLNYRGEGIDARASLRDFLVEQTKEGRFTLAEIQPALAQIDQAECATRMARLVQASPALAAWRERVTAAFEALGDAPLLFRPVLQAMQPYNDQTVTAIQPVIEPNAEFDEEALPFVWVALADGQRVLADPDELFSSDPRWLVCHGAIVSAFALSRELGGYVGPYHLADEGTAAEMRRFAEGCEYYGGSAQGEHWNTPEQLRDPAHDENRIDAPSP